MEQIVRETLRVPAPIEEVWRAWTDPAWLCGWWPERASGTATPGSALALAWDSLGLSIELEVVDLIPRQRLMLRGAPPGRAPQTVTVALAGDQGGTRIELTHDGFAAGARGADECDGTRSGWHTSLRVLRHYLAAHRGDRRTCAAALTPLAIPLEPAERLLRTPEELARWLCAAPPALGAEGDRIDLALGGGTWLSGRVLAAPPSHELALEVDEIDGVLVLRAISLDPGATLVSAQSWSWAPDASVWPTVCRELEEAVARLPAAAGATPTAQA